MRFRPASHHRCVHTQTQQEHRGGGGWVGGWPGLGRPLGTGEDGRDLHNDGTQPCGVKDGVGDGDFESALLAVAGGVGTSSAPFALPVLQPTWPCPAASLRMLLVAGLFLSGRAGRGPGCTPGEGEKSGPLPAAAVSAQSSQGARPSPPTRGP